MVTPEILLFLVLSGFILAGLIAFTYQWLGRAVGWVVALLPLTIFTLLATELPNVAESGPLVARFNWVPSLDLQLTFFVDGLALLMGLIVSGVGTFIMIYAGGYLKGDARIGRFYVTMLVFMAAMLGIVLSDSILLLFIFWELTSISSYLLIGFNHEVEKSRNSARQALLVTGSGGLALLAGLILLGNMAGGWELSTILQAGTAVQADPLYTPALLLILAGAFTKSAQFPFHFWLPNAMAAPTPVSAYLHSATMVKAGVYLLARLHPVMGGTQSWFLWLTTVGIVTAVIGAYLSWQQTDLKRILAYSTVSALGTLVFLLGLGGKIAVEAAVLFLLVHSLYKGGLFMAAGAIDHETGTRDVRRLGGMVRSMPFVGIGVGLAALSMSGIPPLLGFVSKELMYEATLELENGRLLLTGLALVTNMLMVTAASIVWFVPFFGKVTEETAHPHHAAPVSLWLGPVTLGVTALLSGLFVSSKFMNETLLGPPITAVYGKPVELHLALWHGITPMLILSGVTITLGGLLFWQHRRLRPLANEWDTAVSRFGPEQIYEHGLQGLIDGAAWVTKLIQNGYLRYYILFIAGSSLLFIGGAFFVRGSTRLMPTLSPIEPYEWLIMISTILGAFIVISARSRLFAVAGLGVVGFSIAIIYVIYSAPDLAMTQYSIETLTVILFVLVLFRLPRFETISTANDRLRDIIISSAVGIMMAMLVLSAKAVPSEKTLSQYFADNSYELAEGRNIVNVILVDYRGADTLVEITVLAVAALGVYGLLHRYHYHLNGRTIELPRDDEAEGMAETAVTSGTHHATATPAEKRSQ